MQKILFYIKFIICL